jgi:putative nucleotidyltransferase with HDIG domain
MQAVELLSDDDLPIPQPSQSNRRGKRVAEYAGMLAEAIGYTEIAWLRIGAFLRDVGNRKLPQDVLEKPGPLTVDEWDLVRKHTLLGDDLVQQLAFPDEIRSMVRSHHEHWDGSGYPDGLAGEGIPLAARIVCIADVYDALISPRSFRGPFTSEQALEIMEIESGHIFDPTLMQKFASLIRQGGPAAMAPDMRILRAAV